MDHCYLCSQTNSFTSPHQIPDKTPEFSAAVTHTMMLLLPLPLRQNASPHFRFQKLPTDFSPLSSAPCRPRTNPDVIGRSRDGFSLLIGRHRTFPSHHWLEMSQTGNSWYGAAAFKWKEGKGGAGRKVSRCSGATKWCRGVTTKNYETNSFAIFSTSLTFISFLSLPKRHFRSILKT